MLGQHEHLDAAWYSGLTPDQACALQRQNHLMDGRRRDAEAVLDVGFGGGPEVDARVGVDEGQILTLLGREAGLLFARHLIHLLIRLGLQPGGCDECTLSCRPDPIRAS